MLMIIYYWFFSVCNLLLYLMIIDIAVFFLFYFSNKFSYGLLQILIFLHSNGIQLLQYTFL